MTSNTQHAPTGFWTPARLTLTFITFALVATIAVSGCNSGPAEVANNSNNAANPNPGQPPNKTAPANNPATPNAPLPATVMNAELKALDGKTFKLADYQGKIVLVNLWATWCGPCRSEIPDLIQVAADYKAKGVEIIGLTNEDPVADEVKVKDFVKQFNITYKIGWGDQDFALALMQGAVRNNIPQSFIISRDGRVLKRFIGFSRTETPPKLRQALDEAVKEQG